MKLDSLTGFLALAANLESDGQYNNAKLLRAAVDSLLTRTAHQLNLPRDRAVLLAETGRAIELLKGWQAEPALLAALEQSRLALADGRLPTYQVTPDPFVCRICGQLSFSNTTRCPSCGADPGTLKRFRPIYWIEALDPLQALELLRSTPERVAALLEGLPDEPADLSTPGEGWSLRQAIQHLSDAQGVLEFRVNLILEQDNPILESKAVFEWAAAASDKPASLSQVFAGYRASRARILARLEVIPLKSWWRCGRHEEFGDLKLYQQVSYFASHELTHLPQLTRLAEK